MEFLSEDLHTSDPEPESAWKGEIERRVEEIQSGRVQCIQHHHLTAQIQPLVEPFQQRAGGGDLIGLVRCAHRRQPTARFGAQPLRQFVSIGASSWPRCPSSRFAVAPVESAHAVRRCRIELPPPADGVEAAENPDDCQHSGGDTH
ncbi:MAG: addiction module protein [Verrucomicrobia bacterium]|nr:addiction module protein [Verrucomicrobiota bacterium]